MTEAVSEATADAPLFSVIIPTHERPAMLAEAVASVLGQTLVDWELIVVDDGSPTKPELRADPRIRMLTNAESRGPAASRNRGIEVATGHFLAFLDDDDVWVPQRLERALAAHGEADVVVCAPGRLGSDEVGAWHQGQGRPHDWILDGTNPNIGATTIRRTISPLFDPTYPAGEDLDWWLTVTAATDRVAYLDDPDWLWRRHAGARHGIGTERRIEGQKLLMSRHAGYFRRHPRARAFRWRRIGLLSLALRRRDDALVAAAKSLWARPGSGGLKLLVKSLQELPAARTR